MTLDLTTILDLMTLNLMIEPDPIALGLMVIFDPIALGLSNIGSNCRGRPNYSFGGQARSNNLGSGR
jgi:hypothetical protein